MELYQIERLERFKKEITRFMLMYEFALNEMKTKIEILKEEFRLLHDYNPIEHTSSRLKSPKSILKKIQRKGGDFTFDSISKNVKDIAGIRITCPFISDIYRINDMLQKQRDVKVLEIKDYIKKPKSNGYRSLHLLIEIPVFMSDREEQITVEIQIRTIAMDFWASLEHTIYYKYNASVPSHLLGELRDAADSATALDKKMERIHNEIEVIKGEQIENIEEEVTQLVINNQNFQLPAALFELINSDEK
ncbi:GTP pyrophosphokinase family protein [Oceanobacillus sp. HCA-5259]|uniref:GTP pyrophosphokinase n=1 Tax=Oceanobacillus sp. HCA-5259 TaxID=3134661 RepID=UPI0030BC86A0